MQTLSNWNTKAKAGTLAGTKQYSPDLNALLEENKKLKQQLKVAEMEREFLKKAAAYFAAKSITTWTPILALAGHSNKLLNKLECHITWTVDS